jgi:hypothetical protein
MNSDDSHDASNAFAQQPPVRRSPRLRNIAVFLVVISVVAVAGIIAVLALTRREPLPLIAMNDVDSAAACWSKNGPASYDLDMQQTGINPGAIHVEVRRGQVTAMTLNGRPTRQHLWDDWSVPGLLAVIRRDVEACMPELNKQLHRTETATSGSPQPDQEQVVPRGIFDPTYGYPIAYHRITLNGADANWRVTKFQPR